MQPNVQHIQPNVQQHVQHVQPNVQLNYAPIRTPPTTSLQNLHGSFQQPPNANCVTKENQHKQSSSIPKSLNSPLTDPVVLGAQAGEPQRARTATVNMGQTWGLSPRGVSPWALLSNKRDWSPQPQIQLHPTTWAGGVSPQRRYESPTHNGMNSIGHLSHQLGNPNAQQVINTPPQGPPNHLVGAPGVPGCMPNQPGTTWRAPGAVGVSPQRGRYDSPQNSNNTRSINMTMTQQQQQPLGASQSSTPTARNPLTTGPPLANSRSLLSTMRPTIGRGPRANSASPARLGALWSRV